MCGLVTNASRQNWPQLVSSLKCNTSSNVLACMRAKSAREIMDAAGKLGKLFPPPFVPMPDEKTVFGDYPSRAEKQLYIKAVSISHVISRVLSQISNTYTSLTSLVTTSESLEGLFHLLMKSSLVLQLKLPMQEGELG
jgi:hypothetical protein